MVLRTLDVCAVVRSAQALWGDVSMYHRAINTGATHTRGSGVSMCYWRSALALRVWRFTTLSWDRRAWAWALRSWGVTMLPCYRHRRCGSGECAMGL